MSVYRFLLILGAVCGPFLSAQSGESVYTFLDIPVSARQAALGGDAVTLEDISTVSVNPAAMRLDMHNKISVNYARFLAETNLGEISYVNDLEYGHLISVFAKFMDYGNIPRTDESGEITGDFRPADAAAGVGYAYQFNENFTIGGNISLVTSKIDIYNSTAVSSNAAISYHSEADGETVSIVARNFGYQIKTYNGMREKLPFRIDLGFTKKLDEFPASITVTAHNLQELDISEEITNNGQPVHWSRQVADHFAIGAELFPDRNFNLRLGYNVRRGNELSVFEQRSFSGLTFGFGLKVSYFRFDFAHARYSKASNVNNIGIILDLFNPHDR